MREGMKVTGMQPVQVGKQMKQPKRIHYAAPRYPNLPVGTTVRVASGWMGELLLDQRGSVAAVWSIREVVFTPPFPPFNQAITDSLRQSTYEPSIIDGQRVPVCMTVWVSINWL